MTECNEKVNEVEPKINTHANKLSFNFNGEVTSPEMASPTRLNNHLLLKAKSENINLDSRRSAVDSNNNLKLKKKKKKFTWAKVHDAIRKTFHSKKKYTNKPNNNKAVKSESSDENFINSSESNIISSAVYQNDEANAGNNNKNKQKSSVSADHAKSLDKGNEATTTSSMSLKHSTSNIDHKSSNNKNNSDPSHNTNEGQENNPSTSSIPNKISITVEDSDGVDNKLKLSKFENSKSNNNSSSKNNKP